MTYLLTAVKAGTRFRQSYTVVGQEYTATDEETITLMEQGQIATVNDGGNVYTPQNVIAEPTFSIAVYLGGTGGGGGGGGDSDPILSNSLTYSTSSGSLTSVVTNSASKSASVKLDGQKLPISEGSSQTIKDYVDNKIPPTGDYVPKTGSNTNSESTVVNDGSFSATAQSKSTQTSLASIQVSPDQISLQHKTDNAIVIGNTKSVVTGATIGIAEDKAYYNGDEFYSEGNLIAGTNVTFTKDSTTGKTTVSATGGGGGGGNDPITKNELSLTGSKLFSTIANSSGDKTASVEIVGEDLKITSSTSAKNIKQYIDDASSGYAYDATRTWTYQDTANNAPTTPSFDFNITDTTKLSLMNSIGTPVTIPRAGDFIQLIGKDGLAVFGHIVQTSGSTVSVIVLSSYTAIEQQTLFFAPDNNCSVISNNIKIDIDGKTVRAGAEQKLIVVSKYDILPGDFVGTFEHPIKTQANDVLEMLNTKTATQNYVQLTTASYQNVKILPATPPVTGAGIILEFVVKKDFEVN